MAKTEGVLAKFRETITRTTSALRGINGDISELRNQLAALKAQRGVVANAPMSDDEIRAKIKHSLDGYEAVARSSHDGEKFAQPHSHVDGDIGSAMRLYGEAGTIGMLLILGFRPIMEQALFAEAKAYAGNRGIDAATRTAQLAKLDAEIAEVGATLESLLRGLEEVGVSVPRIVGDDPASVLAEDDHAN